VVTFREKTLTARILLLVLSDTYKSPVAGEKAKPKGKANPALLPTPSMDEVVDLVPANKNAVTFVGDGRSMTMAKFPVSATYTSPVAGLLVTPSGPFNRAVTLPPLVPGA